MTATEPHTPKLPPELERDIFEQAAFESFDTAFSLLTVARRVHEWIEPTLYRVVVQQSVDPNTNITRTSPFLARLFDGHHTRCPSSLRQLSFVRAIAMNLNEEVTAKIFTILDACPNVIDLALWTSCDELEWDKLLNISGKPLQRLSLHAGVDIFPPIFQPGSRLNSTLTHLDCFDVNVSFTMSDNVWPTQRWKDLIVSLPRLTHFSIDGNDVEPIIQVVLDESTSLKILILASLYYDELEGIKGLDDNDRSPLPLFTQDPRFVCILPPEDVLSTWESGARGGLDVWIVGEDVQNKKIERLYQQRFLQQ